MVIINVLRCCSLTKASNLLCIIKNKSDKAKLEKSGLKDLLLSSGKSFPNIERIGGQVLLIAN